MKKAITPDWQKQVCSLILVCALSGSVGNTAKAASIFSPTSGLTTAKSNGIKKVVTWTISGRVSSATGDPLPGVTVLLKGTSTGATTAPNGEYTLAVPETAGTIVFSFIGFATQEKAFTGPG